MLLSVAPEIVFHILQYCSPGDLTAIARVHTSLQDIAESVLYHHICIEHSDLIDTTRQTLRSIANDGSLLDTLTVNVRKAPMVKVLYFEITLCFSIDFKILGSILIKLAEALEKMPNLMDLRIKYGVTTDLSEGRISQAIRGGHFQLDTLCLEQHHDFEGIIASQPNLQLLGMYHYYPGNALDPCMNIKKLLQQPTPNRHRMPTFFLLNCSMQAIAINMFPSSHRPGEALQVCRQVGKWLLNNYFYVMNGFLSLSLLGISEENISLLTESMEVAATKVQHSDCPFMNSWLRIMIHDTTIEKPWRIPEFVKSLALFKNLHMLHFYFQDLDEEGLGPLVPLYMDLRSCLLEDLGHAWPGISQVVFHNGPRTRVSMVRTSNWSPKNMPVD